MAPPKSPGPFQPDTFPSASAISEAEHSAHHHLLHLATKQTTPAAGLLRTLITR